MDQQKEDGKNKALNAAISQIEKAFGKGSAMLLGDKNFTDIEFIPTGSIGLDIAVGIGGLPKGRIVEISGPESSGKTTLGLHMIAQTQKLGGKAAIIDAEHSFDPVYAQKLEVETDKLLISQPDNGEQALEITDILIRSGAIDLILLDSVAALTPQAEIEGKMGDSHVGLHARLMSQALRKLTGSISRTKCIVIFINQIRMKIGVMFGSPETTTGGNALKFYSSIRLDIRRTASIKENDEIIGNETKIKVVKNKVAPPFRIALLNIIYNQGICRTGEILDIASKLNIIEKNGSWYSYKNNKLGQGRNNIKQFLASNPEIKTEIEKQIYSKVGIKYIDTRKNTAKKPESTTTTEKV